MAGPFYPYDIKKFYRSRVIHGLDLIDHPIIGWDAGPRKVGGWVGWDRVMFNEGIILLLSFFPLCLRN